MLYNKFGVGVLKTLNRAAVVFRNISIKSKLMVFFLLFSTVPIALIGTISYNKASGVINEQSRKYTETVLKQTADRVESLLQEVSKIGYIVMLRPELGNNELKNLNDIDYIINTKTLEAYFSSIIVSSNYISSIYAGIGDNCLKSVNSYGSYEEESYVNFKAYTGKDKDSIVPFWTGMHENEFLYDAGYGNKYVLSYTRPLFDQTSLKRYGAIIFNISKKVMDKICAPTFESSNTNLYIVDADGYMIYNKDTSLLQKKAGNSYLEDILKGSEPQKSFIYKSNGSTTYVSYVNSKNSNWIYVVEMPIDHLLQKSRDVRDITILIILICIPVAMFASFMLATYMTNPIIKLIESMKRVEDGDFEGKLDIVADDEIGKLARSYNKMLGKIEALLENVNNENMLKRRAELKALQAQITPHFLYNTLNSIKYMAYMDDNFKIHDTTANLIELLHMSISNNKAFITVEEEINLARNYLYLQSIRYDGRFKTVYEFDDDVLGYKTLKLIIQPLVENSLLHGIDMGEGSGFIIIRAHKCEAGLCFEVEDNGRGMSEECLNEIMKYGNKTHKEKFSGIGVANIDERIKMHFGINFGISYTSKEGYGTKVTVTMPLITDESGYQSYV